MRVILDTNVLVSALMSSLSAPWTIYNAWQDGRFLLLTCQEQVDELRATLRKPKIRAGTERRERGVLVNALYEQALFVSYLPAITRSADATDDYLLALAEAGLADYLVSGDNLGLLTLKRHGQTRILSARSFVELAKLTTSPRKRPSRPSRDRA